MITSCENRGFQLTFSNGITISVQFGTGNYCERRCYAEYRSEMNESLINSQDAEIMIWDVNDINFRFEHDDVKGWCDANEIAMWIDYTSKATSIDDLHRLSGIERRADYAYEEYFNGDESDNFAQ